MGTKNPANDAEDHKALRTYMGEIAETLDLGSLKETNDIFFGAAIERAVKLLANDVRELMSRARQYEQKPYLLHSWIVAMANRHMPDSPERTETVRAMDTASKRARPIT